MKLKEGLIVNIDGEAGAYVLIAYDSVNDEWDFKEFCTCRHSCYGGHQKSAGIKKIKTEVKQ